MCGITLTHLSGMSARCSSDLAVRRSIDKVVFEVKELVRQDEVIAMIDDMMGVVLTAMSSMPARCAPRGDLVMRRKLEAIVFEVRTEMADIAQRKARRMRRATAGRTMTA